MGKDAERNGPKIQWVGMSFLESNRDGDRRHTTNRIEMTADAAGVQYRTSGFDTGRDAAVTTGSAHVRAFLTRIDEANRAASAIIPFTKEMQIGKGKSRERRDPNGLVRCPACEGHAWEDCVLCDGSGECSERAAKAFISFS